MTKVSNEKIKIDLVIPWVDDNDPVWISEKARYENMSNDTGKHVARYRDWDNLKYVFRSIEKYMPWINNVFLITCGHTPKWISKKNQKLKIVYHRDFIPAKYLPTFSSHTIELNLFRISELSEHFIYFNDDIFAINTLRPSDFFHNGKPCDAGILNVHCEKKSQMIHSIANKDVGIINEHFQMSKVISENRNNWFNYKYGLRNNIQNSILSTCPRFPGFKQFHMANSFLKSTFVEVWNKENEYLNKVCLNKFRTPNDVNQWLIREWQLVTNDFFPYSKHKLGYLVDFEKGDIDIIIKQCQKIINKSKYKMICINDGDTINNFEYLKDEVNKLLETKFPEKSCFER